MDKELVILFAYHFPPEHSIGGVRPFRFYKNLTKLGYRVHVISAADVTQLTDVDGQYVPDPFITRPRQGLGWQIERFIRRFFIPGVVGLRWGLAARRVAAQHIARYPDYRVTVLSTFPPVGTIAAAYWLTRGKKFRWVADFRDPVADNSVYDHISDFAKGMYRWLEKVCVNNADVCIANTDASLAKLQRAYPALAEKFELIWNGFDPAARLSAQPLASSERKVIAHVGELYGGRRLSPVLFALRNLIDSGKLDPARFQILLVGQVVEGSLPDRVFLQKAEDEGWLRLLDQHVPQAEAHALIAGAGGLLLVQPQSALQVPAKLFEYLQIGRPILAYLMPNSPVERILSRSGVPYVCVYSTQEPSEMEQALVQFIGSDSRAATPSEWFETEFNTWNHALKLSELIQGDGKGRS